LDIAKRIEVEGCGIVVPYSKAAFIEAVIKAASDANLLTEMGLKGRKFYDREYSWNRSRDELLSVYQSVLRTS
jgi:glycosyltransferase involved in cell wall biosynthesis